MICATIYYMGIFARKTTATDTNNKSSLLAQYAPQNIQDNQFFQPYYYSMDRNNAIQVPALARARNLIIGTISSMPLELYRKSSGEELGKPVWMDQPCINQPLSTTLAWTLDSLFFYGVSYWRVVERYQEDGRPSRFEWLSYSRVTPEYDERMNTIIYYFVDGEKVSNEDMVTFQSFDEGVLTRGALTIRAALDLERASQVAAATPMPTGYIKNTGADLDPKEVQGLLAAWKLARQNRSTAYLTSTLEYNVAQFTPKDMAYIEAKQDYATQIARLCNIPAYYLSADANASMTYSNVLDERKQFYAMSLQPYVSVIEDRLSMNDITANGNIVRLDVDKSFLRPDPMQRLMVTEKLLQLGLITIEQAMEMEDLSPNGNTGN